MLLTIDVGNTNIEFGLYDLTKKDLLGTFRLMTKGSQTSDEIGLTLCDYLNRFGWHPEQIEDVIIASVVPGIMYSLKNAMVKYLGRRPLVINEDVFAELGYLGGATTNEHGADRSVACMAAVEKYGAPLLVLDFGTATTVDAVDAGGVYVGGSICPGVRVSMDALAQNAAMLPHVELNLPDEMLGYDTISQIQAGIVGGYVGSMEYLIRRTKAEMAEPDEQIKVVATGGLSRMIADHTGTIDLVDSELILDGLVSIYQKHKAAQQSQ